MVGRQANFHGGHGRLGRTRGRQDDNRELPLAEEGRQLFLLQVYRHKGVSAPSLSSFLSRRRSGILQAYPTGRVIFGKIMKLNPRWFVGASVCALLLPCP